jgi:hypothetical protein
MGSAVAYGNQTELDVAFTDAADERAIPATEIISALAPFYKRG